MLIALLQQARGPRLKIAGEVTQAISCQCLVIVIADDLPRGIRQTPQPSRRRVPRHHGEVAVDHAFGPPCASVEVEACQQDHFAELIR
eukprot:7290692-Lingulodinium_polyedra.AAC.1